MIVKPARNHSSRVNKGNIPAINIASFHGSRNGILSCINDIFLIFAPNIACGCLLELDEGVLMNTQKLCFLAKIRKVMSTLVKATFPYISGVFQGIHYMYILYS